MSTFPIPFPVKTPAMERLSISWSGNSGTSPWTLEQQVSNNNAQWKLQFAWPRMSLVEQQYCQGFIDSLQGQLGTFTYIPYARMASQVYNIGVAQTAYKMNNNLSAGGWSANAATNLRVGQLFSVGNQLLRITAVPLNADGNGRAVITFAPMLRRDYAAGTALEFVNPKGVFRLTSTDDVAASIDPDYAPEFGTISCQEAVEL